MRISNIVTEAFLGVGVWWLPYALVMGYLIRKAQENRRRLIWANIALVLGILGGLAREAFYVEFQHYREIEQMAKQIQPGSSRDEVRRILGGDAQRDTVRLDFFPDSPLARYRPYGGKVYVEIYYDKKGRVESAGINIP